VPSSSPESSDPRTCPRCGTEFEPHSGRGGQSVFCDDCKRLRRREQAMVRTLRVATMDVLEMIELYGSQMATLRSEVTERQDRTCPMCGRQRKLYLGRDDAGQIAGYCQDDWTRRRVA
jgi:DNA-directed RNA polymerase subunit M/transcription elongation factor TFIIS